MTLSTTDGKRRVWMNVTSSAAWTRPAVGVVRVERELCSELSGLYPNYDFDLCILYDGKFVPFDENLHSAPPAPNIPAAETSPSFPRTIMVDPLFGTRPRRKRVATRLVTIAPTLAPSSSRPRADIEHGDVVLSVGLDWNQGYLDRLQELKATLDVQVVTCCYDLIPVLFPQYCVGDVSSQFKDYFTKLSWLSSTVLCISRRSRDDYVELMRRIGAPEVETVIIPLGDNAPVWVCGGGEDDLSSEVADVLESPFILFVSTIERRKNHEILYRAYHLLARAGHADRLPKLVFVGMPGWGTADLLKDIELDPLTSGLIVQLHHVNDGELSRLYDKAYFCAFPSLYEGWGLPIGEALACGKAVIASGRGSIPEVGGDLVTYLDPWNPYVWADEILSLIDHPERVEAMEAAVRAGYTPRRWQDTAQMVKFALDRLRDRPTPWITLYPGYDLHTQVGVPKAEAMLSTGEPGLLTYGPHRALPAGLYDIEIAMDKLESSRGTLRITIKSDASQKDHGALDMTFDETAQSGIVGRMQIPLDEPVANYEICTHVSSNLLVAIKRIHIKPRHLI